MKKFICILVCAVIIFSSCSSNINNEQVCQVSEDSIMESNLPIKYWSIQTNVDEMDDTENHFAVLMSVNTIVQDFPYGKTKAIIVLRHTEKYGDDVLIKITSGQIYRSLYDGHYIIVRFDDGSIKKYAYLESSSGSSDIIFIRNSKDFIKNCRNHRVIKIKIPLFQYGEQLFTFSPDSLLEWEY